MKMAETNSYEVSVLIYETGRPQIPECSNTRFCKKAAVLVAEHGTGLVPQRMMKKDDWENKRVN
jgi:hypothetical protein